MGQYYYLDGPTPMGPFSLRDVYTLLDREVIHPATMMCREGGADWQELMAFHELTGKTRARGSAGRDSDGSSSSSSLSEDGTKRRRRRGASSSVAEPAPNRLINLTAVIIAVLFSAVAVYVTYTIGHANQEVSIDQTADLPPSK